MVLVQQQQLCNALLADACLPQCLLIFLSAVTSNMFALFFLISCL